MNSSPKISRFRIWSGASEKRLDSRRELLQGSRGFHWRHRGKWTEEELGKWQPDTTSATTRPGICFLRITSRTTTGKNPGNSRINWRYAATTAGLGFFQLMRNEDLKWYSDRYFAYNNVIWNLTKSCSKRNNYRKHRRSENVPGLVAASSMIVPRLNFIRIKRQSLWNK